MNKRATSNFIGKSSDKNYQPKNLNYKKINKKLLTYDLLLLIFIFIGVFLIRKSFSYVDSQNITYKETSNLDYKVKLKQNDFYETDTLNKGMVYVASLIDKVDINFNYEFMIDKKSNINFEYDIIGKLIISDNNDRNKTFFQKDYILLKNNKDKMNNNGEHKINQDISIDYGYYNNLANKFRINYGVDTSSNLIIYLNIHEKNESNSEFDLNNNSAMSLTIPLSQKAVNITMDYKEINKTSKLVRDKKVIISSYLRLILGIISLLIGIYFVYKYIRILLKLRIKRTKYDKYIRKILNEYDRLIVETTTPPTFKGKNIIEINRFQELLDVRDNLRLPIKYYVVDKHKESNFYINHDEELYILIIKESDIE